MREFTMTAFLIPLYIYSHHHMKRGITTVLICAFLTTAADAQTDADALRFGMLNYGSTARSLGMGNAFGALGADFSALAINPCGVATISPIRVDH